MFKWNVNTSSVQLTYDMHKDPWCSHKGKCVSDGGVYIAEAFPLSSIHPILHSANMHGFGLWVENGEIPQSHKENNSTHKGLSPTGIQTSDLFTVKLNALFYTVFIATDKHKFSHGGINKMLFSTPESLHSIKTSNCSRPW